MGNDKLKTASETKSFYESEVAVWRGRGALFWSTAVLPACCFVFVAVHNFSITHPYEWITGLILTLFSISKWMYMLLICVMHWMLSSHRINFFSVSPEVKTSQWSMFTSVITLKRLVHVLFCSFGCSFICWSVLQVVDGHHKHLYKICVSDKTQFCLDEQHLFVVMHAAYLGIISTSAFFYNNQNLIHYPVIQQSKWDQIRGELPSILKDSARFVLRKMKYYYIFYYLFLGHILKHWILNHLPISINQSERVDSIFGLIDLWIFLTSWLTGTLLYFFTKVFSMMYSAYQTQPYEFVVQSTTEIDDKKKLPEALACDSYPLLQFQGYQDLCLLAKNSQCRRAQLFSLSTLGGHPYNWISVSAECLASLTKFCEDVKGCNTKIMTNGTVKHVNGDTNQKVGTISDVADLSFRKSAAVHREQENVANKESLMNTIYKEMCKKKLVANILCPSPDSSCRGMLSHAQKYIWNIEALSHLVTASYNEDTYGVVQKSLPEIISTLVALQEEIEKMIKLASTISRNNLDSEQETALHTRLRATLKSAIYNIGCVFGEHIESISISQEVKKRLRQFTEYKV